MLSSPSVVNEICVAITSEVDSGTFRVRIYGQEGGNPYPKYTSDIIEPKVLQKRKRGVEYFWIKLERPIKFNKTQFFVAVDLLTRGIHPVVSGSDYNDVCIDKKEVYGLQYLQYDNGDWVESRRTFAFAAVVEQENDPNKKKVFEIDNNAFKEINIESKLANNRSFSVYDINRDGFVDVLTNGKLLVNTKKGSFYDASEEFGIDIGLPQMNFFIDADGNGKIDICMIDNEKHESYLLINDGRQFTPQLLHISALRHTSTYTLGDINSDGLTDIYIGQYRAGDSTVDSYLLLNKGFGDYFSTKNIISIPAVQTVGSLMVDRDFDGDIELIISDEKTDKLLEYVYDKDKHLLSIPTVLRKNYGAGRGISLSNKVAESPRLLLPTLKKAENDLPTSTMSTVGGVLQTGEMMLDLEDFTFGGKLIDYDNDNDNDIFLTSICECRSSDLYKNENGKFIRNEFERDLYQYSSIKESLWLDYDNDTDMDLLSIKKDSLVIIKNLTVEQGGKKGSYLSLTNEKGLPLTHNTRVSVMINGEWEQYVPTNGIGIKIQESPYLQVSNKNSVFDSIIVWDDAKNRKHTFTNVNNTGYIILNTQNSKIEENKRELCITSTKLEPQTFSSELYIQYTLKNMDDITIELFSLAGEKLINRVMHNQTAGEYREKIVSTSDKSLSSGTYLLKICCSLGCYESIVHCVK